MSIDLYDFLPKYPNIDETKYDILNPYQGEDFYNSIFHKMEFYENKLTKNDQFPKEKGTLTKYQRTIARFLSFYTPYDRLLLVHSPGLGKCVLPGTLVISNGKIKKIEELWEERFCYLGSDPEGGEWSSPVPSVTLSYDEKTRKIVPKKILKLYRQRVQESVRKILTTEGLYLFCTKKHKLLEEEGWTNNIKEGGDIYIQDGNQAKKTFIKNISDEFYSGYVYDLEVEETHNYVANGFITHNTCSAIGAIEQIISEETNVYDGALILAKGNSLLENFTKELVTKCTIGQYMPEGYASLSDKAKKIRTNKKTTFYQRDTFMKFSKKIQKISNPEIEKTYSNKIIVIDEIHNIRIKKSDKEEKETYNQIHRFLHTVKNCKILLLSGTPMKDGIEELASVGNLLLPLEDQFPVEQHFLDQYADKKDNIYIIKKDKQKEIKEKLKGKISFLKEAESSVKKIFLGQKNYGGLKYFQVFPMIMSEHQSKYYLKTFEKERKIIGDEIKPEDEEPEAEEDELEEADEKKESGGIYINSRQASLFVFPDGSFGKQGFDKYIKIKRQKEKGRGNKYQLSDELIEALTKDTTSHEEILQRISKYSCLYSSVINFILQMKGNCFIYSSFVSGSGAILFSLLLELFNFKKSKGVEKEPGLRYGLLTNETASDEDIRKINQRFNMKDNKNGEFIKVIIGSRTVAEGFSFKNVIFEAILTPHWNYSETSQALARGIRLGSHADLSNPEVKILQGVSIPANKGSEKLESSIDLIMYKISEDKDVSIRSLLRLLMECAFDCGLNYDQNFIKGENNSRECYYNKCDYNCDGLDMKEVKEGISDSDNSTYQLYYTSFNRNPIYKKMENLFKTFHILTLKEVITSLQIDFSEEEIKNVFTPLINDEFAEKEEATYEDFKKVYMNSAEDKITDQIKIIFKDKFSETLQGIKDSLPDYTQFQILLVLRQIIENNVEIENKYGFKCYLREKNNIYFLIQNISSSNDYYLKYYVENPIIFTGETFQEIFQNLYEENLPVLIDLIFSRDDEKNIIFLLEMLPNDIKQFLLEHSLKAKSQGLEKNAKNREMVLTYFKAFFKESDSGYISTFSQQTRCLEKGVWKPCEEKELKQVELKDKEEKEKRLKNEFQLLGKVNETNQKFCIIDLKKEEKTNDKRKKLHGKVCEAGWNVKDLADILIHRLKVDPPDSFKPVNKSDKRLLEFLTQEEIEKMSEKDLTRFLYWKLPIKSGGGYGNKVLCKNIRENLDEKGLIEYDNECGNQGKNRNKEDEKEVIIPCRVTIYRPGAEKAWNDDEEKKKTDQKIFDTYTKAIKKNAGNVGFKEFKITKENEWIFLFKKASKTPTISSYFFNNKIRYLAWSSPLKNKKQITELQAMLGIYFNFIEKTFPGYEIFVNKIDISKIKPAYETCGIVETSLEGDGSIFEWKKT